MAVHKKSGYKQQGPQPPYDAHCAEGGKIRITNQLAFTDKTIRAHFVCKVFILVGIMLSVVTVMSAIPFTHQPIGDFVQKHYWLSIVAYVIFLVVFIALVCCERVRRSYPCNIILLGILTIAIGFMTMMISAQYTFYSVFIAFAITTICCAGVAVFAILTKRDLTSAMGILFIATLCLCVAGLLMTVVGLLTDLGVLPVVYATIGALIFMFWVAIDIQMIMGGHKYEIGPEDYIYAAMKLFLDIIQVLWFILSIVGKRR